ncbi:MAG: cobalamin biosynthesis protein CbiD [Lachnospiraceae bacterium]|nr:cobalamin biosynthesis protein CbiD [Lachnospiraceae bacterium]
MKVISEKEKQYITVGNKKLELGFTTGSCAAAAAKGAAQLLLAGKAPESVDLLTPEGILLKLRPEFCRLTEDGAAVCGIKKHAGDDPDITDGMTVAVKLVPRGGSKADAGIRLTAGDGVGTVTLPGLEQPVGAPAINKVPRQMIRAAVREAFEEAGIGREEISLTAEISVPGGTEIAQKTFNPKLGIVGGISILGTSGIVKPMSRKALKDTISLELDVKAAAGTDPLILCPGNYGTAFLKAEYGIDPEGAVRYGNYFGYVLDEAAAKGFKNILIVSHIGKLIKVAGGIMNTHSRAADCRMEIMAAHALLAGADAAQARKILSCVTTDAALELLEEYGMTEAVMRSLAEKIREVITARAGADSRIAAVAFARDRVLFKTDSIV